MYCIPVALQLSNNNASYAEQLIKLMNDRVAAISSTSTGSDFVMHSNKVPLNFVY